MSQIDTRFWVAYQPGTYCIVEAADEAEAEQKARDRFVHAISNPTAYFDWPAAQGYIAKVRDAPLKIEPATDEQVETHRQLGWL
jgi:hypothetical protein